MSFGKYSVSGIQNDFLNTVLNKKSQLKISHAYVLQELLEHLIITDVFAISTDLGWFKCLKNGFYISNNYWPVTIYSTKQVLFYPYNFLMEFSISDHCDPWQNFTIMHIAQIQAPKSALLTKVILDMPKIL